MEDKGKEVKIETASSFVSEKIKEKPLNKGKLFRRSFYIAASAIVFGIVACFTFLVLEPIISNWLYPEKINKISIPDEEEEVSPEEFLTEKEAEKEAVAEATQAAKEVAKEAAEEVAQSAIQDAQVAAEPMAGLDSYEKLYTELHDVAIKAERFVVEVTGLSQDVDWFQETIENKNSVSGIIVADNGVQVLVLADLKHLDNADSYSVSFYDDTVAEAKVLSEDSETGLGVFAIDHEMFNENTIKGLEYATLGNSNTNGIVGKPMIAIGSPMGDYGSICYGVINSVGGTMRLADATYNVMTSDIYGSEKTSGVFINTTGEVIGMICTKAMENRENVLISAISISDIKLLIEKLSNDEAFAYLGVYGMDVTAVAHNELGIPYGAYVTEVDVESPAMNAGVTRGDVITKINGVEVKTFEDYHNTIMKLSPGAFVEVVVARFSGGEYREISCQMITEEAE